MVNSKKPIASRQGVMNGNHIANGLRLKVIKESCMRALIEKPDLRNLSVMLGQFDLLVIRPTRFHTGPCLLKPLMAAEAVGGYGMWKISDSSLPDLMSSAS